MNSKIMLLLALSLASSTITVNAMDKLAKIIAENNRRAAAAKGQLALHEVNCNGKCWKCDPIGRAQQGAEDKK